MISKKTVELDSAQVLESLHDPFFCLDANWNFTYVNDRAEAFFTKLKPRVKKLVGKNFWKTFPKATHTSLEVFFLAATRRAAASTFEYTWVEKSQTYWLEFRVSQAKNGLAVQVVDITHYRQDQEYQEQLSQELREHIVLLDTVFYGAPIGMGVWDEKLSYLKVNKALAKMNGVPAEDHIGKSIHELLPGNNRKVAALIKNILTTGQPVLNYETIGDTPAQPGMMKHWLTSFYPIKLNKEIIGIGGIFEDITQRKKSQTERQQLLRQLKDEREVLRQSEENFRHLAESMPQIVWSTNNKGKCEYFNSRWYEYTGLSVEESFLRGWKRSTHPDDYPHMHKLWRNSIKNGETYHDEVRLRRASDGEYIWHLDLAIPIRNSKNKIIKWFGTSTNIHEQKIIEQKKDEFIGIASHELKTPLTSIKGYGQLLERHLAKDSVVIPAKVTNYLTSMLTYVDRLEDLINDLLDVAKIQSGRMAYAFSTVDLDDIVKNAVRSLQPAAKKHKLIVEGKIGVPVYGDTIRLEQVVINLLTNALKYSPGADKVNIALSKDASTVTVAVTDYGMGIPARKQKRIFERYYRAEETAQQFFGLGIGLYISSEIIRKHQGKIWVDSHLGKGSTFYFTIPIEAPNPTILEKEERPGTKL